MAPAGVRAAFSFTRSVFSPIHRHRRGVYIAIVNSWATHAVSRRKSRAREWTKLSKQIQWAPFDPRGSPPLFAARRAEARRRGVAQPGPTPNRPLGLSAAVALVRARPTVSPPTSGPNLPHGAPRCVHPAAKLLPRTFRVQSASKVLLFYSSAAHPNFSTPILLYICCALLTLLTIPGVSKNLQST